MSLWSIAIGVFFGVVLGGAIGLWVEDILEDELAKFNRVGGSE